MLAGASAVYMCAQACSLIMNWAGVVGTQARLKPETKSCAILEDVVSHRLIFVSQQNLAWQRPTSGLRDFDSNDGLRIQSAAKVYHHGAHVCTVLPHDVKRESGICP